MKIFRILSKKEYKCLIKNQSIFNPDQVDYPPEGMLFPENNDKFGKFFFFELEDIYNFVYNYSNATPNDVIIELDIDRKTALKYLTIADYSYFDPTKSGKKYSREEMENLGHLGYLFYTYTHAIPELFIDHNLINEKIGRGDYQLLPSASILKYPNRPKGYYEGERNPKTIELARRLDKVREIRKKINNKKHTQKKLNALSREFGFATQSVIDYFPEFAREHEKYLKLVPAEREPE